jgi:hypothetical protein
LTTKKLWEVGDPNANSKEDKLMGGWQFRNDTWSPNSGKNHSFRLYNVHCRLIGSIKFDG